MELGFLDFYIQESGMEKHHGGGVELYCTGTREFKELKDILYIIGSAKYDLQCSCRRKNDAMCDEILIMVPSAGCVLLLVYDSVHAG